MTRKKKKEIPISAPDPDDEELVLTDEQMKMLQAIPETTENLRTVINNYTENLHELIRTVSNIDPAEWRNTFENQVNSLVETIDPDAIPDDLGNIPIIRSMVKQLRAGNLEQAKQIIFQMRAGTFQKLVNAIQAQEPAISQNLRKIEYIRYYGLMNDKLTAEIIRTPAQLKYGNGQIMAQWGVNQAGDNRPEEVPVFVSLTYHGKDKLPTHNWDPFNDAVICAIAALGHAVQAAGGTYPFDTTIDEIYRTMNGIRDTRKTARPAQAKRISASMERMRFSQIYIDRTEEAKMYRYKIEDARVNKAVIDDNVLHARHVTFETENHREVNGYRIYEEPISYTYNREKNHVLFVPYELLDVSETTRIDGHTIEIRNYLLNRIESMYTGALNSRSILFDTLYKETGIVPPDQRLDRLKYKDTATYEANIRKQRAKDKNKVADILTAWKKKKYINGFQISTAGNYSVSIVLNPEILAAKKKTPLTDPELLKLK